jgi:hypothetical protein
MKKLIFIMALCGAMLFCSCKSGDNSTAGSNVNFTVAKNYFFKNGAVIPDNPKISSADEFQKLFGMAAVMGKDGIPTAIDFSKQFVLAVVLPVTDVYTEIQPVDVKVINGELVYEYSVKTGEKMTYSMRPMALIVLDREYDGLKVKMVEK